MKSNALNRLKLAEFKLNSLLEITKAINDNLSNNVLLKKYEKIITKDLGIGKLLLFSKTDDTWSPIIVSGIKNDNYKNINVDYDLYLYTEITHLSFHGNTLLSEFDVIIPVYNNNVPIAYVLLGDIEEERGGISPIIKHFNFIQTLTNILIVAIENRKLNEKIINQQKIKHELELARRMQSYLIPSPETLPYNDNIKVLTYYQPHFEVGGDYYDFFYLNNEEIAFCIADVSGKGISAALIMSNFQASLRALFTSDINLNDLIKRLNTIVNSHTKSDKFITAFLGKYNLNTKILTYINAGHIPPILYSSKSKIKFLKEGCPGIGMLSNIDNTIINSIQITEKTRLICFTDGLIDIENEKNIPYGTNEIERIISTEENCKTCIGKILASVNEFRGKNQFFDDVTILLIEFS
ncbi:MAG: PP2C family protein-serine/threonine phosphatase [Bacteroidales bacterium]|nr:PP2C family protein-serine/threonine phosphatase [Bacteroidales bacterium]